MGQLRRGAEVGAICIVVIGGSSTANWARAGEPIEEDPCLRARWEEILAAAERHLDADRRCLEVLAGNPDGGIEAALARALLAGWGTEEGRLPDYPTPEPLEPFPCFNLEVREEIATARASLILFGVRVGRDGRPLAAKLVRRPGFNEDLKLERFERCAAGFFQTTRFRPAARGGRFIAGTFFLGVRVCFF